MSYSSDISLNLSVADSSFESHGSGEEVLGALSYQFEPVLAVEVAEGHKQSTGCLNSRWWMSGATEQH